LVGSSYGERKLVSNQESGSEKVRVIRGLLADAETDVFHTADEAMSRRGVVAFLRAKLHEAEKSDLDGN
jgi:hypothetical protein